MASLFHRTMLALERTFTADLLASEIDKGGITRLDAGDGEIVAYATANGYSRVPLAQGTEITHVAYVNLSKQRMERKEEIDSGRIIDSSTPLTGTIEMIASRRYLFLKRGPRIEKILTASDLNKLPGRVFLSSVLLHWEELLSDTIARATPDDDWLERLDAERRMAVANVHRQMVSEELDRRAIDCTVFSDKVRIMLRTPSCRSRLAGCERPFNGITGERACKLRNAVLHGRPFATWERVRWLADALRDLTAWIEVLGEAA